MVGARRRGRIGLDGERLGLGRIAVEELGGERMDAAETGTWNRVARLVVTRKARWKAF